MNNFQKEVVVVVDVLISVVPISELHIDYDRFENEATPYITPTATSESSFFLVSECGLHLRFCHFFIVTSYEEILRVLTVPPGSG